MIFHIILQKHVIIDQSKLLDRIKKDVIFLILTKEQQAILDGSKGESLAKVMETLVRYGEVFHAEKMVPITSDYNHLVTSFGLKALKPVYALLQKFADEGICSTQKFTVDPKPLDKNVPSNLIENLVFKKFMYTEQEDYENLLKELGLLNNNAFTCTCYLDQVGNTPKYGDVLSWAESSAVVYANSVLGARCNRNSGIIDIFGSLVGYVPYFGLLTDQGRKAKWIVEIKTSKCPEAQLLGSAIGMKVMEDVPYVKGLDRFLGNELNDEVKTYLKDFGAATASNGAVGLYHIEGLTPEAVKFGEDIIETDPLTYVIDDKELERIYKSYPIMWKNPNTKPKLCFLGCPHMSLKQLTDYTFKVTEGLKKHNKNKVTVPTVFTASPDVIESFKKTSYSKDLEKTGIILSYICPLMYLNNPVCAKKEVITSSNKLRTYTNARFYKDEDIIQIITGGEPSENI